MKQKSDKNWVKVQKRFLAEVFCDICGCCGDYRCCGSDTRESFLEFRRNRDIAICNVCDYQGFKYGF